MNYYSDQTIDFDKIDTPDQFIKSWREFNGWVNSDTHFNSKNPNWKNCDNILRLFVEKWNKDFKNTIEAITMNNYEVENYKQFLDFKKHDSGSTN